MGWIFLWDYLTVTVGSNPGEGVWCVPVQTGPAANSTSCTMGIGSFQGVKRQGRTDDFPPLSSAEVVKGFNLYLPLRYVPLHECYNVVVPKPSGNLGEPTMVVR